MGKPRYFKHPRAILQSRRSKNSKQDTLMITIPRKAAEKTGWRAGDIIEFQPIIENERPLVKLFKV